VAFYLDNNKESWSSNVGRKRE